MPWQLEERVYVMPRSFHLLTESEPFSEHLGGAISRWAANVLRDDKGSVVLAPSADESWGVPADRVRVIRGFSRWKVLDRIGGKIRLASLRRLYLRKLLVGGLHDIQAGDCVWIHNRPEYAAALAPWLHARGVRMVLMLHNSHLVNWPETIVRRIGADRYVFVSRYLQAEALGRFPWLGETAVLHNGADPAMFYPGPRKVAEGPPVVIFAGRLVPEKGLHIFVEAMRRLAERGVGTKGLVVGGAGFGGTAPTEYVRRMRKSAPSTVVFEAYCSGVAFADKLRAADIFCLPSCWEDPFPLAPIEAMACGLPVVSTRSGGIPEMFSAGGGILVERGSVEQLASVLELLIKDRGTREKLATEARACFVTRFTWEAVRKNYRDIVGGLAYTAATKDLDMLRHAGESAWEENESYS